jgi:putative oxygen-independent coproporphyrinogen III oxidase
VTPLGRPAEVTRRDAGIYIHVPFCLTRCGYCDFNAHAGLDHLKAPFVEALLAEADLAAPAWEGTRFVSVFLGGGTPTTLPPAAIAGILDRLRARFHLDADAEITVEANPDTVDRTSLAALREAGVTRLSMGAQSFDPWVLRSLERIHRPEAVRRAFGAVRAAGFEEVNLDLIYGTRGETPGSWARTVEEALALGPEHLSCYALTIEPGTPLGRRVALGLEAPPDPDEQADRYEAACARLAAAGYRHYELSNWARPGTECLHNLGYWHGRPYLGLGPGAHSSLDGRRWWTIRSPERYVTELRAGRAPLGGEERPGPEAIRLERLLLGLRLSDGVPGSWVPAAAAEDFLDRGLARRRNGRFVLTEAGMLLANDLVAAAG